MNRRRWTALSLGCSVGGSIAAVVFDLPFGIASMLIAIALALWLIALISETRSPTLSMRAVLITISVALTVAAVAPPRGSHDVWSYAMYGRIQVAHHEDPYSHPPAEFNHDPFLARVNPRWRATTPVYGPLFVAVADGIARIASDDPLTTRLLYQLLGALCAAIAVWLVVWRTRRVAAAVMLGLSPVVLVSAVNGAHVDLWLLPLLGAAALALERRRWVVAAFALAAAMLIKITVVFVILGLCAWLAARSLRRASVVVGSVTALVVATGYAVASRHALHGLRQNAGLISRSSIWMVVRWALTAFSQSNVDRFLVALGTVVVAVATVWLCAHIGGTVRSDTSINAPIVFVAAAGVSVGVSAYVLPWYSVVPLMFAAWSGSKRWGMFAVIQGVLLFGAHLLPPSPTAAVGSPHPFKWLEALAAIGCCVVLVWSIRQQVRGVVDVTADI